MNSKSSTASLSSSSPLASYRSKYMRSDGSPGNASSTGLRTSSRKLSSRTGLRKSGQYGQENSSSSCTSRSSTKIRPERRLRSSSSASSSKSLNSQSSFEERSTKLKSSSSLVSSTSSGSPLESLRLRQHREYIETSSRIDDMRRQLEKKPRLKALKSLSDRTRSSKPKSTTSRATCKMRYPKDDVRLSEFTSITASLSDDEEDVNDDDVTTILVRKADPACSSKGDSPATRGAENDVFGTILSKIVDHVKIAASSSSSSGRSLSSKSESSNNLGYDDTTEHRSNYSKRRLSIQVRRASDFLFSSHHREDDHDEEEEEHQWEVKVEDSGVDDVNDWDL